jgi:hypothetical protein
MKSVVFSELLILVAVLAVAYLVYQQQGQISDLELELDRVRGAVTGLTTNPVPPAEGIVNDTLA